MAVEKHTMFIYVSKSRFGGFIAQKETNHGGGNTNYFTHTCVSLQLDKQLRRINYIGTKAIRATSHVTTPQSRGGVW